MQSSIHLRDTSLLDFPSNKIPILLAHESLTGGAEAIMQQRPATREKRSQRWFRRRRDTHGIHLRTRITEILQFLKQIFDINGVHFVTDN